MPSFAVISSKFTLLETLIFFLGKRGFVAVEMFPKMAWNFARGIYLRDQANDE